MGSINFDVAALCILGLNFFLFFSRSRLYIAQTRVFFLILMANAFASITDITTVLLYCNESNYHRVVHYTVNISYYIFQNSIPLLFVIFLLALCEELKLTGIFRKIVLYLPWFVCLIFILSTPLTGYIFFFDEKGVYTRGPMLPFLYAIALLYIVVGLYIFYKNNQHVSWETRSAVFLFLPFSLLAFALQFFYSEVLIQNLGIAVSGLIVLLTIQDFGTYTDHMTRLYNRNGFFFQVRILLQKHKNISIFLVSLDTVNFLNLVLGHEVFSSLEREVVRKLFGFNKEDRFTAQTGPGRFILVIADQAQVVEEREMLLEAFSSSWKIEDRLLSVSARICEIRIPEDTPDIQVVFQAQHELTRFPARYPLNTIIPLTALSLANTGRNRAIAQAIDRALLAKEFIVYFQPIICEKSRKIVAAEALLRLNDSILDWIPPDEFIPIAEQNGTIHRIGDFVVQQSCFFLTQLRNAGFDILFLEVNLSAIQCLQANLSQRFLTIVQEYGLKPQDLCFEITETAANLSPGIMKRNLESLVNLGFSIAIDDFGTGYSNISSLMEKPFSIVKFDRSLVEGMSGSKNGMLGMNGLVRMFRHMKTALVAEGVETEEQLIQLRTMNIDYIQGYYYSRPLPPQEFFDFLLKWDVACI